MTEQTVPLGLSSGVNLVQIQHANPKIDVKPSRFNARSLADDGNLILYNSYTGAFNAFPSAMRSQVEQLLRKGDKSVTLTGISKYLFDRGFLVPASADELRRLRLRYGAQQNRPDTLELILLSSEECNFRCVYCYETFPRGTMVPWVQEGVVRLLESRAQRLRRFSISYFGGEPLLGITAIENIAPRVQSICREEGIVYSAGMTTNGFLLERSLFDKLISWDIRSYQITIDGAPSDHDQHRHLADGGGTAEVIISNLLSISKSAEDFRIAIRVNFDRANISGIPELLQRLELLKNDPRFVFRFYPIGRWGGENDAQLDVCGTASEHERQRLDAWASDLGFKAESRLPYLSPGGMSVCYAARPYSLIVGADGKLMKCTVALDTRDYNIVGMLTSDGRTEIDVDKLAKWVAPYMEEDTTCQKCFYSPVCQGCSCPIPRIESSSRPCPPEKLAISSTLRNVYKTKLAVARHKTLINN